MINTAHLDDSYRSGEKESSTETEHRVGTSPKQEKWSLHQEWSSAVQAAHPSLHGLRVPRLEVRCSLPCQETAGASVQVLHTAAKAPWYTSNRQIHKDLGVSFTADHIRSLAEKFDSKVADLGKSLARHLADIYADRELTQIL